MQYDYTEVKISPIDGYGVFAKKPIPKGTIWWKIEKGDFISINQEQFKHLMESEKTPKISDFIQTISSYSFYDEDTDALIFCLDNGRFVNHSDNPNAKAFSNDNSYWSTVLRDIKEGEEITENYHVHLPCKWFRDYIHDNNPNCW